ncbi:4-carboxymuconolactone decarboxylase [Roseomonas alkaliterrae]|jgi:4-carboxymuconolactone decarboxylase|uniref:4-carboxymuconolactone decarboxylase n=1 Tax=Neoroseomonas alkaliterrae TaxID=1452450 RepID=A0A840XQ04_9PROT|nr:carboxymuconolactone decarboxylase family protein [Neoroseomonas alkaliterrae]MBB5689996.1 4-carboxymuconolactone decarboxylase [Neoroseomonas alkaliterrae]MBR0675526.1 4-carboxymuconolactone decarboxylase [Neoroseomonas alkaliterrae]
MTDETAHEALRATGRQAMREVLGEAYMARRDASTTPLNQALRHLSEEFPYASLWTRGTLTRRERSMVTIGMLVALSQHHELRGHLVGALNNGCTPEEIAEVITHACAYAGFPAAIAAMRTAEEVLREAGAG